MNSWVIGKSRLAVAAVGGCSGQSKRRESGEDSASAKWLRKSFAACACRSLGIRIGVLLGIRGGVDK